MNKKAKDAILRLNEIEELNEKIEKDLKYFKKFTKRYEAMEKNLGILTDYYMTEWYNDVELAQGKKGGFYNSITNQDTLWETIVTQDELRIKLLKQLVKSM